MRPMSLRNVPTIHSDLALFLPFIPAVKVRVPCRICGSAIPPGRYEGNEDTFLGEKNPHIFFLLFNRLPLFPLFSGNNS